MYKRGNIGLFFRGDPTLKLWMPFEEGSGTTTRDLSGSGNHGTLNGGALFNPGKFNNGIYFDGSNDYIDCGNGASLNITNAITIGAWIKPTGASNNDAEIIGKTEDYKGYSLYAGVYGQTIQLLLGNGDWIFSPSYTWPNYNVWYCVVGTWDGQYIRLYVNGINIGTPVSLTGTILTTTNTLKIGKHYSLASYFKGLIDEVAIFSRALSSQEISQYYQWATGSPKKNYYSLAIPEIQPANFFPFF